MAIVSVLYIDDDVVGPHLELLRNVCEPASTSRPHVTVRFFERLQAARDEHFSTEVAYIDLVEPGEFVLDHPETGVHRTVYIRCESVDLEPLKYKPHFPWSEFHVTLYDGDSATFAAELLRLLRQFSWGFRVSFPERTTLREIHLKTRRPRLTHHSRQYGDHLRKLFHEATSERLDWTYLTTLSDDQRLKLAQAICKHLHKTSPSPDIARMTYTGPSVRMDSHDAANPEIHVTPPELALDITEYAVSMLGDANEVEFGDPAVGTGEFYQALCRTISKDQITSAIGVDINAQQVAAAQKRWSDRGLRVIHGDYLHMEQQPLRTLVLANPPYLRHQKIDQSKKDRLRERASVVAGTRVSARSGMYVYFLLLSHGWMKDDAVAAWLIPSEFMQSDYGAAVRHYLTRRVELIRVHQFSPSVPQFENADVAPSVVVFRNRKPQKGQTAVFSTGDMLRTPSHQETVSIDVLRNESRWSIPTRSTRAVASASRHIGDLFTVRRGIATGANDFFILERSEAAKLGIPDEALRPILPKVRTLETPVIERDTDGYPRLSPQLCVLDCHMPEDEIMERYPSLMRYLLTADDLGIRKRNLIRSRNPWYSQERRDPSPFVCTYMGRGTPGVPPLRFIWNKSDAVAANTYLMLYPRDFLAKLMRDRPETASEVFAILQKTAEKNMSENWRTYAGGLRKIEPGELLRVTLVPLPEWLDQLADPLLPMVPTE